jgi:hypothetical protein
MWTCPICQHTDIHHPGVPDENARVVKCTDCPRCRKFLESVRPSIPKGFTRPRR